MSVTIGYTGTAGDSATIEIYRLKPGAPRLVKSFATKSRATHAIWDERSTADPPRPVST
jgi:hypothetical protein